MWLINFSGRALHVHCTQDVNVLGIISFPGQLVLFAGVLEDNKLYMCSHCPREGVVVVIFLANLRPFYYSPRVLDS